MHSPQKQLVQRRSGWRWAVWSVFFLAWTIALLVPIPAGMGAGWPWLAEHKFYLAKGLHVTAYAVLAMLSAGLPLPCRFRWALLFLIMVHATVTELLQRFVEGRTGLLSDVGLDHLGIALGLLLTWKRWSDPA